MKKLLIIPVILLSCTNCEKTIEKEQPKKINQDSLRLYKAEKLMDSTFNIINNRK